MYDSRNAGSTKAIHAEIIHFKVALYQKHTNLRAFILDQQTGTWIQEFCKFGGNQKFLDSYETFEPDKFDFKLHQAIN